MAVSTEKIKERLKVLFPKANLSQKRLDDISARLAKKPEDDAEDDVVDQVINDANDLMDFVAIAKEDDRIRTLEAKSKAPETTDSKKEEQVDNDDAPAWAKVLIQKVDAIEKGEITKSKQSSIRESFSKSEVLKNLSPEIQETWLKRIPLSEDLTQEQINEHIISLESEFKSLTQFTADNQDYSGAAPSFTSSNKKEVTTEDVRELLGK